MRIGYIAAGAGAMYCGACHRDAALFGALAQARQDLLVIPLYTPLRTDRPLSCDISPVFMGGITLYLAQTLRFFRRIPAVLRRQLDRPALLRQAARLGLQTAPAKLGPMTVGMLRGSAGPHVSEIDRLVRFLRDDFRPDLVHLSNSLLIALAPAFRDALKVPVVCSLQGEDAFVEALPDPHRGEALRLVRAHARAVDRFVTCAAERKSPMARWLDVPEERLCTIVTGIDAAPFTPAGPRGDSPGAETRAALSLGYLSSIRPEKGLDLLIDALGVLVHTHHLDVHLHIAGQVLDKAFWRMVRRKIRDASLAARVTCHGELDLPAKVAFHRNCQVFVMPTRLAESRAIAAMEALAAGVPVVATCRGVLPELLAATQGGVTVAEESAEALAEGILTLLRDEPRRRRMGAAAADYMARHATPAAMARHTVAMYEQLLAARAGGGRGDAGGAQEPSFRQTTSAVFPSADELRA